MACEICEHCQSPVLNDEKVVIQERFSYHKKCHKCYVCSETDLLDAEMFKGVLFCSSCAQRIFRGCSTARRTKTMHTGRVKRTRSKSHSRRKSVRARDKETNRSRDGVIELARLAGSTISDSEDHREKMQRKPTPLTVSNDALQVDRKKHVENCFHLQTVDYVKKDSTEMGTTTDVTQDLLKNINFLIPEYNLLCTPPTVSQTGKHYRKKRIHEPVKNKQTCSDLRIAELGMSTEIANMALRKKSEDPVTTQPRFEEHTLCTISLRNLKSDKSSDETDWMDSVCSTIAGSDTRYMMDRRLGSILKLPLQFFKKNILTRSSLISILMSTEDGGSINLLRRLKQILHQEMFEHQVRGLKRLYPTINRRKTPYKLGWAQDVCVCSYEKRCRHFKHSHSYRCMRAQVMKLAGPTTSELAVYRHKIKRFIAPSFIRNVLINNKNIPALKLGQACSKCGRS